MQISCLLRKVENLFQNPQLHSLSSSESNSSSYETHALYLNCIYNTNVNSVMPY